MSHAPHSLCTVTTTREFPMNCQSQRRSSGMAGLLLICSLFLLSQNTDAKSYKVSSRCACTDYILLLMNSEPF